MLIACKKAKMDKNAKFKIDRTILLEEKMRACSPTDVQTIRYKIIKVKIIENKMDYFW